MKSKLNAAPTAPADADLRALAEAIAADTGVAPEAALQQAAALRPSLRQFAGRWNARVRRLRAATQRSPRHRSEV